MPNAHETDFVKQRIQIISFFILGMAFIFQFMFDIVYTQRSYIEQVIISGSVMEEPLLLFSLGLLSMFFYSRFLIKDNKKNLELGGLFFYLFSVTVVFSLLDMFRMSEFFTYPQSTLFYISNFVFNLGLFNILMVSFIVYSIIRLGYIKSLRE